MSSEYFEIDMFQAGKGDCFLVRCGDQTTQANIIIDTGMPGTEVKILNRLQDLNIKKIDLLVITHIDEDHIGGASELLNLFERDSISIKEIWHNSCVHLNLQGGNNSNIDRIRLNEKIAFIKNKLNSQNDSIETVHAGHGSSFSEVIRLLKKQDFWNETAKCKAICIENVPTPITINNLKITLLTPDRKQLNSLADFWNEKVKDIFNIKENLGYSIFEDDSDYLLFLENEDEITEMLKIEKTSESDEKLDFDSLISIDNLKSKKISSDSSKTNGSSITFMIEFLKKKALFLGDAQPKPILECLNKYKEGRIFFDLIKLPHHGSIKNITDELLKKFDTDTFLISSKGDKHPDQETIALIIEKYKNSSSSKKIISNYKSKNIARMHRDFNNKNNIQINFNETEPYVTTVIL